MSGINFYPLRSQDKNQRVISSNSNISLTSDTVSSLYYCENAADLTISITLAVSDSIPVGSQYDFVRTTNSNVSFNSAPVGLTIESSSGATPKIRVRWGACSFVKTTSNTWVVIGDITT